MQLHSSFRKKTSRLDQIVTLKNVQSGRDWAFTSGRSEGDVAEDGWELEDQKALHMAELLLHSDQENNREYQRAILILTLWVVRNKLQAAAKRGLDLALSLILIPLFSPFMALTALAIKVDSPGPVLFRQERVGLWGKRFYCYKFRSMVVDADAQKAALMHLNEADDVVFKMKHDPRITRVGQVIRKLSIDELPQLFNVFKGEMSLVGPRPPVPVEVDQYTYDQFRRLDAVPGITGLQQISGRSDLDFERWVELDVQYIEQQSLLKDIEILVRTLPAVITGRGAY